MSMSSEVVLLLADSLIGIGYWITTGNYYTSPQLLRRKKT